MGILRRLLLVLIAITVNASVYADTANVSATIIKSPFDTREYESLVLENGLRVVLVSDKTTDKAAASLDVNIGSGDDPADRAGLAHFLEHMLFLGTAKYPDSSDYKDYMSAHGGANNAYTSFDHTNYFFDIDKDHLEGALDRFAQFFVAPLFTERYVTRERQVVHSEYTSKKRSDGRRGYSVLKAIINPRHPLSKFSVGNLTTLADRDDSNIRDELIDFYDRHYSANIMTLAVLGKEPIPVLRRWVIERFSDIKNHNASISKPVVSLFKEGTLPAVVHIEPVKARATISLEFTTPPVRDLYKSKPMLYISNLIGHEGEGSLLSLLKEKGWADGLSAGAGTSLRDIATFNISLKLTDTGKEHIDDVIAHTFQYIEMLKDSKVERWIFDENRKLIGLRFKFEEKSAALPLVRSLANDLHYYPAVDVLRGAYALNEYRPDLIRSFLNRLTPENLLVTITTKGVETDLKTKWFETPYRLQPLSAERIARWRSPQPNQALALPTPNIFIPENLALKNEPDAKDKPEKIIDEAGFELWFQNDTSFKLPHADIYFTVRSPAANVDPRQSMMTRFYVALVNDQLNEFSYPAHLAGLSYDLYKHIRGFSVRVEGYSDKQDVLIAEIVKALKHPRYDQSRFEVIKADTIRRLKNELDNPPYHRAMSEIRTLVIHPQWNNAERLAAAESISLDDVKRFVPSLLKQVRVVALAHGNIAKAEALRVGKIVDDAIAKPAANVNVKKGKLVRLVPGQRLYRQIENTHDDATIAVYIQGDDKNIASRATMALLSQIVGPQFFENLRTEKQLGYIVFSTGFTMFEIPGIGFVVQSPTTGASNLEAHINGFFQEFKDHIENLGETEFEQQKSGLLTRILESDTKLSERTDRYWTELDREYYEFDFRDRLANAVRAITLDELQAYYDKLVTNGERKQLVVWAKGRGQGDDQAAFSEDVTVIKDTAVFKQSQSFFPAES